MSQKTLLEKKQDDNKPNSATMHKPTEDRISGRNSSHLNDKK